MGGEGIIMTEEQLYGEAFRQMGSAPLELDEAQPPRRGRPPGTSNPNAGRPRLGKERRRKHDIYFDADVLALVQAHAETHEQSVSESVNQLVILALK
jgi:hypothetical protein